MVPRCGCAPTTAPSRSEKSDKPISELVAQHLHLHCQLSRLRGLQDCQFLLENFDRSGHDLSSVRLVESIRTASGAATRGELARVRSRSSRARSSASAEAGFTLSEFWQEAARAADFRRGIKKVLLPVRKDLGPNIAAFHHNAAQITHFALPSHHPLTHRG